MLSHGIINENHAKLHQRRPQILSKMTMMVTITVYYYDDDYDDDAYTDTKAVLMMLIAIMIVGMRDGVNIEKDDDDSDDRSL